MHLYYRVELRGSRLDASQAVLYGGQITLEGVIYSSATAAHKECMTKKRSYLHIVRCVQYANQSETKNKK